MSYNANRRSVIGAKWDMQSLNEELYQNISKEFNVTEFISQSIVNNNPKNSGIAKIKKFLNPSQSDLPSIYGFKDLEKAADRIVKAILNKEKITVYGDYDADGGTSTSVITQVLEDLGISKSLYNFYIPDRFTEGYGPNVPAFRKIAKSKTNLIVTVDNGIGGHDAIDAAKALGVDTVVTDHHAQKKTKSLPNAVAVVNPNRVDENSGFKESAGVAMAFYLMRAVVHKLEEAGYLAKSEKEAKATDKKYINLDYYLPLVAVGLISDVVPLTRANRYLVKRGMELINDEYFIIKHQSGLYSLIKDSKLKFGNITSQNIAFQIGPRLNACGRLEHASISVDLLCNRNNSKKTEILAREITNLNEQRKEVEKSVVKDIESKVRERKDDAIVMAWGQYHQGVVGIVASRVKELFHKPSAVGSIQANGDIKFSARSIEGVDLGDAIFAAETEELLKGGGHKMAAGFTVKAENIEKLQEFLNKYLKKSVEKYGGFENLLLPVVAEISLKDVTMENALLLDKMEPFGTKNEEPIFLLKNPKIIPQQAGSKGLRNILLTDNSTEFTIPALAWSGSRDSALSQNLMNPSETLPANLLVKIKINRYFSDKPMVYLEVKDAHFGHLQTVIATEQDKSPFQQKKTPISPELLENAQMELKSLMSNMNLQDAGDQLLEKWFEIYGENKIIIKTIRKAIKQVNQSDNAKNMVDKMNLEDPKNIVSQRSEVANDNVAGFVNIKPKYKPQNPIQEITWFVENPKSKFHISQADLKHMHENGFCYFDYETTGLKTSKSAISEAVAMKVEKDDITGNYKLMTFWAFVSPFKPEYKEYLAAKERGENPIYDRTRYEYEIGVDAFAITGTEMTRESFKGPITEIIVEGKKREAKPFYEIAEKLKTFFEGTNPIGYNNANFDAPFTINQMRDSLGEEVQLPVQISKISSRHDAMLMFLKLMGQGASNRQDDAYRKLVDKNFDVRGDHSALEDVLMLAQIHLQESKSFLPQNPSLSIKDIFSELFKKDISIDVYDDDYGNVTIRKNQNLDNHEQKLFQFLYDHRNAQLKSSRVPKYIMFDKSDDNEITISAGTEKKAIIISSQKRLMAYSRMLEKGLVEKVDIYNSTSVVDVTLFDGKKILNVPFALLRINHDFLLEHKDKASELLEIIKDLSTKEKGISKSVGGWIVSLSETEIRIKSHARSLAKVSIPISKDINLEEKLPEIKDKIELLYRIGGIPGADEISDNSFEDDDGDEIENENDIFSDYNLDTKVDIKDDKITFILSKQVMQLALLQTGGALPKGISMIDREDGQVVITGKTKHFQGFSSNDELQKLKANQALDVIEKVGDVLKGGITGFLEMQYALKNTSWLFERLKKMPDSFGATVNTKSEITLDFKTFGLNPWALQYLQEANIPFTADANHITIPIKELIGEPSRYTRAVSEIRKNISQTMENKTPPTPDKHILEMVDALFENKIHQIKHNKQNTYRFDAGSYTDLLLDKHNPKFEVVGEIGSDISFAFSSIQGPQRVETNIFDNKVYLSTSVNMAEQIGKILGKEFEQDELKKNEFDNKVTISITQNDFNSIKEQIEEIALRIFAGVRLYGDKVAHFPELKIENEGKILEIKTPIFPNPIKSLYGDELRQARIDLLADNDKMLKSQINMENLKPYLDPRVINIDKFLEIALPIISNVFSQTNGLSATIGNWKELSQIFNEDTKDISNMKDFLTDNSLKLYGGDNKLLEKELGKVPDNIQILNNYMEGLNHNQNEMQKSYSALKTRTLQAQKSLLELNMYNKIILDKNISDQEVKEWFLIRYPNFELSAKEVQIDKDTKYISLSTITEDADLSKKEPKYPLKTSKIYKAIEQANEELSQIYSSSLEISNEHLGYKYKSAAINAVQNLYDYMKIMVKLRNKVADLSDTISTFLDSSKLVESAVKSAVGRLPDILNGEARYMALQRMFNTEAEFSLAQGADEAGLQKDVLKVKNFLNIPIDTIKDFLKSPQLHSHYMPKGFSSVIDAMKRFPSLKIKFTDDGVELSRTNRGGENFKLTAKFGKDEAENFDLLFNEKFQKEMFFKDHERRI